MPFQWKRTINWKTESGEVHSRTAYYIGWYEDVYDPGTGLTKRIRHNLATKCKTKAEFNEYFRRWKRPNSSVIRNVLFTDFTEELMESVKTDYSPSTVAIYHNTIREFLAIISDKYLHSYTCEDILKYKNVRLSSRVKTHKKLPKGKVATEGRLISGVTFNIELRVLRAIFNNAIKRKFLESNPCDGVSEKKVSTKPRLAFKNEQLNEILPKIEKFIPNRMTLFALNTGCRINEIVHVEWSDLEFENGFDISKLLLLREEYKSKYCHQKSWNESELSQNQLNEINEQPEWKELARRIDGYIKIENKPNFRIKTNENRTVPMTIEVIEILCELKKKYGHIKIAGVPQYIWGRLYDKGYISKNVGKVLRKLGYPNYIYTFHSFRHTCISNWVKAGIPLPQVQEWAGHKNIQTTMKYMHNDAKRFKGMLNNIKYQI